LTAVAVKARTGAQPLFEAASPQALFDVSVPAAIRGLVYTVAADGKRLLVNTTLSETAEQPLTVVVNWLAAVRNK
jgi:hypothetical protein